MARVNPTHLVAANAADQVRDGLLTLADAGEGVERDSFTTIETLDYVFDKDQTKRLTQWPSYYVRGVTQLLAELHTDPGSILSFLISPPAFFEFR